VFANQVWVGAARGLCAVVNSVYIFLVLARGLCEILSLFLQFGESSFVAEVVDDIQIVV
jgi:hypothetical protein